MAYYKCPQCKKVFSANIRCHAPFAVGLVKAYPFRCTFLVRKANALNMSDLDVKNVNINGQK